MTRLMPSRDTAGAAREMLDGLVGVTPGPWQVIEQRWPWQLQERELLGAKLPSKSGEHIERQIATIADHPQTKAPWEVVCLSTGVGTDEWKTPVYFVHIEAKDAAHIARCSPDNLRPILEAAIQAEALRAAIRSFENANTEYRRAVQACTQPRLANAGTRYALAKSKLFAAARALGAQP